MDYKQKVAAVLKEADIELNGSRPWDPQIQNDDFYARVIANPSLGLGEAYMDGWWDAERVDLMIEKILLAQLDKKIKWGPLILPVLSAKLLNSQSRRKAFEVGEKHYDIGNDLFERMLDRRMTYTCGYWKGLARIPENLDRAQEAKLDLVCRKIGLKAGDHVLDIGCGWGSFMIYAAEKYGARCTGVSVSKEQVELGRKRAGNLPIEFKLVDYRELQVPATGPYDHVISLGMFEHVGPKNYRDYMAAAHRVMKEEGLFLLHTIGKNAPDAKKEPFMNKYIFPNAIMPTVAQIGKSVEGLFVMEDWHNFGFDYNTTLAAWRHNFNTHWSQLAEARNSEGGPRYSERFYRMWNYYLLICMGAIAARRLNLWQIVLSPKGVSGGYISIR